VYSNLLLLFNREVLCVSHQFGLQVSPGTSRPSGFDLLYGGESIGRKCLGALSHQSYDQLLSILLSTTAIVTEPKSPIQLMVKCVVFLGDKIDSSGSHLTVARIVRFSTVYLWLGTYSRSPCSIFPYVCIPTKLSVTGAPDLALYSIQAFRHVHSVVFESTSLFSYPSP
jgi:hypothetical protein